MNKRWLSSVSLLVMLGLWAWAGAKPAYAADFQVATCDNAGLLAAYNSARASAGAGPHNVLFDANCAGATINVTAALPDHNVAGRTVVINGGGNVTLNGGGGASDYRLVAVNNGTIELRGLIIQNFRNGTTSSGGAFRVNGTATAFGIITNSSFIGNSVFGAIDSGAAHITTNGGGLTISNSYFANNSAGRSGGAVTFGNTSVGSITNSTFVNNTAVTSGGAIHVLNTTNVTINNVTTSGNSSPAGNALRLNVATSAATVRNSIFSEAAPCSIIGGATLTGTDNNHATAAGCTGFAVSANAGLFSPLTPAAPTANVHPPALPPVYPTNPAVNTGSLTCAATDQRGVSRTGLSCDAGAMEAFGPTAVTTSALQTTSTAAPSTWFVAMALFYLLGLATAVRLRPRQIRP